MNTLLNRFGDLCFSGDILTWSAKIFMYICIYPCAEGDEMERGEARRGGYMKLPRGGGGPGGR